MDSQYIRILKKFNDQRTLGSRLKSIETLRFLELL